MKILLVDDHRILLDGLKFLIENNETKIEKIVNFLKKQFEQ